MTEPTLLQRCLDERRKLRKVAEVARLIDHRFAEGSLQGDLFEGQCDPDDYEPIQHQLRRALANLDKVA